MFGPDGLNGHLVLEFVGEELCSKPGAAFLDINTPGEHSFKAPSSFLSHKIAAWSNAKNTNLLDSSVFCPLLDQV